MNLLSRRSLLAIATVVDVASQAESPRASAKAISSRHKLPPRHLETLLQRLVHAKILKGVRGPRGGYELARERGQISVERLWATIASSQPCLSSLRTISSGAAGAVFRVSSVSQTTLGSADTAHWVPPIQHRPIRRMLRNT